LIVYADTSFLVSLYLPDQHSAEARRRMEARPGLWLTPLHRAEWTHAVARHVFLRDVSAREVRQVYADFELDRATGLWNEASLPERAFERCIELAQGHVPRLGFRTLDTLHVACALELQAKVFWTFDDCQQKLARAMKLRTTA
jgi:predicted nucleic acid-binding protein